MSKTLTGIRPSLWARPVSAKCPYSRDDVARFMGLVEFRWDGCWCWQLAPSGPGAARGLGYGLFSAAGQPRRSAHRASYLIFVGPVPEGLQIDHLCSNRMCVNPSHLEAVTQQENLRRGAERRTLCRNGLHDLTPDNIYVDGRGRRSCLTCTRAKWRRKRVKRRTAA